MQCRYTCTVPALACTYLTQNLHLPTLACTYLTLCLHYLALACTDCIVYNSSFGFSKDGLKAQWST